MSSQWYLTYNHVCKTEEVSTHTFLFSIEYFQTVSDEIVGIHQISFVSCIWHSKTCLPCLCSVRYFLSLFLNRLYTKHISQLKLVWPMDKKTAKEIVYTTLLRIYLETLAKLK